jgi:hypothetical protein
MSNSTEFTLEPNSACIIRDGRPRIDRRSTLRVGVLIVSYFLKAHPARKVKQPTILRLLLESLHLDLLPSARLNLRLVVTRD